MTQTLEHYLSQQLQQALENCEFDTRFAKVAASARPELGQFQCNAAMALAKPLKQNPFDIAEKIVAAIPDQQQFSDINIARPGFINLTLSDDFLAQWCQTQVQDSRLGCPPVENPRKVVIDFGGPNVAKPMHVGHIRSSLLGDCLQRLYRFCGDDVVSDVHLGDWGTQMGMLIEAVKRQQPELPYFDPDFKGDYPSQSPVSVDDLSVIYPEASSLCKSDPEEMEKARLATAELQNGNRGYRALWQHFVDVSMAELKKDFAKLGVSFDLWNGESSVQDMIPAMVEKLTNAGFSKRDQGALIIDVADNENDKTPPLILVKSDGAVMYGTTDLATIVERVEELDADLIIYVVDKRQSLHFKQVFAAAKKCQLVDHTEMKHVGFGTVNGRDGKPFKTRAGGVMKLSALIDEARSKASERDYDKFDEQEKTHIINTIALATVKFADLANSYASDYIFDLEKFSKFEGKTGPYLLYSAVRIQSILRKAEDTDFDHINIHAANNALERDLQLTLTELPQAIAKAYQKYEPHHLCEFAYKLASVFSRFYSDCTILNEEDATIRESRLGMAKLTLKQLQLVLTILGIDIPERM